MRKAKRKGQRILAAALCVGLLAGMMPAQAFAEEAQSAEAVVQQEETTVEEDAESAAAAEDATTDETPSAAEIPGEESPLPEESETSAADTPTSGSETTDEAASEAETSGEAPQPEETEEKPEEDLPAESEAPAEETSAPSEAPTDEPPAAREEAAGETTVQEQLTAEEAVAAPEDAAQIATQAARAAVNYIATYQGEIPTVENVEWPTTVSTWDFMELYSQVTLTSTAGETYVVEVIPKDTVYFIDSGTGTDWKTIMKGSSKDESAARDLISKPYEAVSALVGDDLLNKVSDQAYTDGKEWGVGYTLVTKSDDRADPIQSYWNNNVAPADGSDITNKYAAGLRASNDTNFEYYLTLDAGTYTLVTGFHEFYNGNHSRGMTPKIYDAASNTLLATFDKVSMSNNANSSAAPNVMNSGSFTLTGRTTIKVQYEKSGSGENGSMNWLSVYKGKPVVSANKSELQKAVQAASALDLNTYAAHSKTLIEHALATANALLGADDAAQDDVDTAAKILNAVVENASKRDYNAARYTEVPVGETWLDTEGDPIQAHGGGFLQQTDTDGTPIYYWAGEDKTHNTSNFNGISLYSSKDLLNWTYRGTVLQPDVNNPGLSNNKIERPKLVYNAKTGKYVLWGHWEDKSGYSSSQICVATSDTVDGTYTFLGHWRPGADADHRNWRVASSGAQYDDGTAIADYSDSAVWGTGSRDFTIYVEGEKAYLVSAENHETMRLYRLNDSFTDVDTSLTYQLFNKAKREAPALVKIGEYYFMISSAQSGWYPNQSRYSYTKNIEDAGSWQVLDPTSETKMPVGFIGNNTTFYSQPTNIMTVTGSEETSYIYMGDRWNSKQLGSSTYVWLPLTVKNADTETPELSMDYLSGWKLDAATGKVESDADPLISQGKPATTDAAESTDENLKLANANDGNYYNTKTTGGNNAYFKPMSSDGKNVKMPFTYTIDLESVYDLSRIDLSFNCWNGSEAYHQYTVDVSLDGTTWTTAANALDNTTVGFKSHSLTGKQGRYVRLSVNKAAKSSDNSSASWAAGLVEVQVYGKQGEEEKPTATPTPTPKPTTAPTATPAPTAKPTETPAPTAKPTETPAPTTAPTATPVPMVEPVKTEVVKVELTTDNISQELQDKGFTTTEKIEAVLKETIAKEQPVEHVEVYEVTLRIKHDDGTIGEEVSKENFPKEGLEVAFDLPAGIKAENAENYDFLIAHLKDDGSTELMKPILKDGKLVVIVHSLSPFAVSWKAKEQPAPTEKPTAAPTVNPGSSASGGNNTSGNGSVTGSPAGTAQPNTATAAPAKTIPQTSDSFPVVPLAALAVLSLGGLVVLFLRRKTRK